jgi:hypothetical protein
VVAFSRPVNTLYQKAPRGLTAEIAFTDGRNTFDVVTVRHGGSRHRQ